MNIIAKKIKLGFLASGSGSNMRAMIDHCHCGQLHAEPVVVISNNAQSGAIEYARKINLPAFYLSRNTHSDMHQLDEKITKVFMDHDVDWVILAGYMKKVGAHLLKQFQGKIFNVHPALLPKYGGRGMYGIHVHEAVLASGDAETGATIHLVVDEYDHGSVLAQVTMPVLPDDTPALLAERVLEEEHKLYSVTLQKIITGEIAVVG